MKGLSPERVERREVPAERPTSCSPPPPAQLLGTPPDRSAVAGSLVLYRLAGLS